MDFFLVHTDMKGSFPKWLTNYIGKSFMLQVKNIFLELEKSQRTM